MYVGTPARYGGASAATPCAQLASSMGLRTPSASIIPRGTFPWSSTGTVSRRWEQQQAWIHMNESWPTTSTLSCRGAWALTQRTRKKSSCSSASFVLIDQGSIRSQTRGMRSYVFNAFGLEHVKHNVTPGSKPHLQDAEDFGTLYEDTAADCADLVASVKTHKQGARSVAVVDVPVVHEIQWFDGPVPINCLIDGPIVSNSVDRIPVGCCTFTGRTLADTQHDKSKTRVPHKKRCAIRRHVLLEGAAWDVQTVDLVADLDNTCNI